VTERDEITQIVKAVAPRPVNVLVTGFNAQLSLAQLADLGVRRISVGSGLALAAWGSFIRAARKIADEGDFTLLGDGAKSVELNSLFAARD
jgi:2-methylisocitrate lyase-like PEP mutase family enzyme